MNHLKLVLTVLSITIAVNFSQAQDKTELKNTVLWKIEHADLKEPSYIFGTLHFMCESDFSIPEKVSRTLENIDALVLEVNLTDPEEQQVLQESMANTTKISEELSEQQFNELDELLQKVVGVPLTNFDSYGLSSIQVLLMSKMLSCTQLKSLETELSLIASKNQTPIYSLEKVSFQLEMMKRAFTTDSNFDQIMLFESYKKDFNNAIEFYKKQDITAAVNLITKEIYMDENATAVMQTERNKIWVEKMPQMMKERSNLFAVGGAHLTNEYGIIHLLRQKGYTVTPVFN